MRSEEDCAALVFAAVSGHKKVVGLLLRQGASIEAANKDGKTTFQLANMYRSPGIGAILERAKPEANTEDGSL